MFLDDLLKREEQESPGISEFWKQDIFNPRSQQCASNLADLEP